MKEIFLRTSVRHFKSQEVEPEKIEKLLRAAMQSPTATNQQSWEFYVITNKEVLHQLSHASQYATCCREAPLAIVIVAHKDTTLPEYNDIDCAIAAENIWLEAKHLGLGTVMLGIAPIKERIQAVNKILDLPDNLEAFTILPIGYPLKEKEPSNRYDLSKIHVIK